MARRLDSLDFLRGGVMLLMAIDHCRDYFSPQFTAAGFATPENIPGVGPDWFLTRWITHFCAPVFVLLAGTGVFLYQSRGRSREETARFLLSRGVWLIVLELTLVHLAWFPTDPYRMILFQVIWAIGASFIVLAGLIYLPRWAIGVVGVAVIGGHNALALLPIEQAIAASPFQTGWGQRIWMFVHTGGAFPLMVDGSGWRRFVFINYPILPWVGVMACGYALGPVMLMDVRRRVRVLLTLGAAITIGFVLLRFLDVYGDPHPWRTMTGRAGAVQEGGRTAVELVIAFLNVEKYPASLLFLMMTLGPALVVLGLADAAASRWPAVGASWAARFVITFGRVPLFFYVLHLFAIQLLVAVWALSRFGAEALGWGMLNPPPAAYAAHGLWPTYAAWVVVVVSLYPACRWYAGVKRRSGSRWLSYL